MKQKPTLSVWEELRLPKERCRRAGTHLSIFKAALLLPATRRALGNFASWLARESMIELQVSDSKTGVVSRGWEPRTAKHLLKRTEHTSACVRAFSACGSQQSSGRNGIRMNL